ncbi:glutamate-5-semialdehyde dehydrogenase [Salisediminibacterium beveridgei]|uniref:Gamma-glutamyl phosphate reductase n=1 Tax=Salisediminibacterium beveridgei TaxID=632773 RepID=A0A1D7QVL2_9BACI|nr:glutamate-5-semialdehyde dehydrogenase [Salisediminibacterium beveridgei]AOM82998.1 Gamma-glutamyl phosphate reductase [Salisediminibacterium beveridgei]
MTTQHRSETFQKAEIAKIASKFVATASVEKRHQALTMIKQQIQVYFDKILEANNQDAAVSREKGVTDAYLDRLTLTPERLNSLITMIEDLVQLPDPLYLIKEQSQRPNGLIIKHVTVPLGVLGIIYEARPNVTVDTAALALKTGNVILLRGSSSTIHTNRALVSAMQEGLHNAGFPKEAVQLIEDEDRTALDDLCHARGLIDVLIPRGSEKLIRKVTDQAVVPVIETGAGNCHVFIDSSADPDMAINIAVDAKTQRPSVCNACETILVSADWFEEHGMNLITALQAKDVVIHGDPAVKKCSNKVLTATEEDWKSEFLSLDVAMKVVTDINEAIDHIEHYSTNHSESIVSNDSDHVKRFFSMVDAAALYHNASTRFTDGFEFGYGAEVGISTQKLHVRGPMGLPALTTTKALIQGSGQTKA